MSEKEKQMLVSEVNILRELSHPNIVKYYDRVIDRDHSKIYIVQEYCDGGDISTLIKNSKRDKKHLPEDLIWSIMGQMLLAL
jgi:serine/threonine protein kinase